MRVLSRRVGLKWSTTPWPHWLVETSPRASFWGFRLRTWAHTPCECSDFSFSSWPPPLSGSNTTPTSSPTAPFPRTVQLLNPEPIRTNTRGFYRGGDSLKIHEKIRFFWATVSLLQWYQAPVNTTLNSLKDKILDAAILLRVKSTEDTRCVHRVEIAPCHMTNQLQCKCLSENSKSLTFKISRKWLKVPFTLKPSSIWEIFPMLYGTLDNL